MEYTNKLNLILPKGTDAYNIEDFNENFQKIDTASTTKPITTTAQDIDEFITSEEAQNIVSGETIIISSQIYMFMGGSSSDKDNYISYSGNSTEEIGNHVKNTQVHLTDAERTKWNTVDPHTKDKTMHITGAERTKWNTIDSALSTTSTNAIQNKAVAAKIAAIETQNSGFESSLEGLNNSLNDVKELLEDIKAISVIYDNGNTYGNGYNYYHLAPNQDCRTELTYQFNNIQIALYNITASASGGMVSSKAFDFTNYNKLLITYSVSSSSGSNNYGSKFGVSTNNSPNSFTKSSNMVFNVKTIMIIDISTLIGNHFIKEFYQMGSTAAYGETNFVHIYKIELQK